MSGISQHSRKPAMLAVLIAIAGLGAASAMAAMGAASGPKPFELVLNGAYEDVDGVPWATGLFTSKAPFCESGSAADVDYFMRRFACADGSGSITLEVSFGAGGGHWRILEGTGQYADLRGTGTSWQENSSDDGFGEFRSTLQGVVDADAVGPTITVASAQASKVKGTTAVYTVPVALDIRDNVEGNSVTYTVKVTRESGAGPWLFWKSGEAIGPISFEFRVRRPNGPERSLLIRTTAVDPIGNESTLDTLVQLPK